jgi:hypothetical protein
VKQRSVSPLAALAAEEQTKAWHSRPREFASDGKMDHKNRAAQSARLDHTSERHVPGVRVTLATMLKAHSKRKHTMFAFLRALQPARGAHP